MRTVAEVLVVVVALLHVGFAALEMLLWQTPRAMKAFGTTRELAAQTSVLAANQGLYNLFLAAGLIWGVLARDPTGFRVMVFFLLCVLAAGVFGAVTVSRRILLVQALPAALALLALIAS